MPNPFAYAELHTTDAGRAKEFYRKLFDWKLEDAPTPGGNYTLIHPGEGIEGGLLADEFAGWQVYVSVADLVAATRRARELGAQVLEELREVPGEGRFSVVRDPTGVRFALWEKAVKK